MRVTVFGANGATGRLLCRQLLDQGHGVVAVTRRPDSFPVDGAEVVQADATDPAAVTRAVQGADAVLSVLGTPFTRQPITLYSTAGREIVAAMQVAGVRRLAVVTSSAAVRLPQPAGGLLLTHVLEPLVTRTVGRTTYQDMRRLEKLVTESGLDWVVLRPSGLFDHPEVTAYELADDHAPAPFTARADLAAALVQTLTDDSLLRRAWAVSTTQVRQSLLRLVLRESAA